MKKKCLVNWLEGLRSGEYPQSRGALRNEQGYCGLGVLCEQSGLADWKPEPRTNKFQYLNQIHYLPKEVAEWAGMSEWERWEVTAFVLTYQDNKKISFAELADLLEGRFKKVEKPK